MSETTEPSAAFTQALQGLGEKLGVSPQDLANGAPTQRNGIAFWILNHGQLDAEGLTVAIRAATLPADAPVEAFRHLLVHNSVLPVVHGFFAMMPGADEVVYCVRFDLAKTSNAADTLLAAIDHMASELVRCLAVMNEEIANAPE